MMHCPREKSLAAYDVMCPNIRMDKELSKLFIRFDRVIAYRDAIIILQKLYIKLKFKNILNKWRDYWVTPINGIAPCTKRDYEEFQHLFVDKPVVS